MKFALHIEADVTQIILTPETELEEKCVSSIGLSDMQALVMRGYFYACQGGYTRQSQGFGTHGEKESIIIKVTPPVEEPTMDQLLYPKPNDP